MSKYTVLAVVCIAASIVLIALRRESAPAPVVVRFASYNAALNREHAGALLAELRGGASQTARQIAEVVQRQEVDVLLLCELDRDDAGEAARVFAREYLAVSQNGQRAISFPFVFAGPVNTGEPSGRDLDGDGRSDGPGDAYGFGRFPGQYGMALLSRHPIGEHLIRTFGSLSWSAMPGALRPNGFWSDEVWGRLRLSSKSHWDVPIQVLGRTIHVLCSHPTPPAFDGPEDRNGCRNHDEIRFWVDYLTAGRDGWIVDDAGLQGGLAAEEPFVLMGDLNCDPVDGSSRRQALADLLAHPRVQDPAPRSQGGVEQATRQWGVNAEHRGDPALDTGDFGDEPPRGPGNLRVDYVLVGRPLRPVQSAVFWPQGFESTLALVAASDHRLVWVDVDVRRQ
ncbi:MAG: endonuclease/exonuclease/phosphatase family protein [Planctomycetes bacterium]|nr:endonuclease/exonuclease/phosphatase family protein [Planctomycetota bacterium]